MSVKKIGKAELFISSFRLRGESGTINMLFSLEEAHKVTDNIKKSLVEPLKLRLSTDSDYAPYYLYCLYRGYIYKLDRPDYTSEEMVLQIMELEDKERHKFERLKHRFSEAEKIEKEGQRLPIPEEVRIVVWRRDDGKCVKCGSRENLEYDHIIPISKGGSNTVRNIELLCEKCNREKKDKIQ